MLICRFITSNVFVVWVCACPYIFVSALGSYEMGRHKRFIYNYHERNNPVFGQFSARGFCDKCTTCFPPIAIPPPPPLFSVVTLFLSLVSLLQRHLPSFLELGLVLLLQRHLHSFLVLGLLYFSCFSCSNLSSFLRFCAWSLLCFCCCNSLSSFLCFCAWSLFCCCCNSFHRSFVFVLGLFVFGAAITFHRSFVFVHGLVFCHWHVYCAVCNNPSPPYHKYYL